MQLDSAQQESLNAIEKWYSELQKPFKVIEFKDHEFSELVQGIENRNLPVHKWYNLKEAFSARLPVWIVERIEQEYGAKITKVADPFIGGGTTGIALTQHGIDVDGLEYSPFIHFVASTKATYPSIDKSKIESGIAQLELSPPQHKVKVPLLSTLSNKRYFRSADVKVITHVVDQIRHLECDDETRCFLLLGVAAAVDDVANLRKDGRALRYSNKANRPSASDAILSRWREMIEDLDKITMSGKFHVFRGTATNPTPLMSNKNTYDLVFYSPPYLNNFDYTEVYKLELWFLNFVRDQEHWRNLRRSTIRSHPSLKFEETAYLSSNSKTADLAKSLCELRASPLLQGERTKRDVSLSINGYFDDMYQALLHQWEMLRPGGFLVYVVANSRHNMLPIATDVILGAIAQRIGFQPKELVILKKRNGRTRQKAFLHESAVILQKPKD